MSRIHTFRFRPSLLLRIGALLVLIISGRELEPKEKRKQLKSAAAVEAEVDALKKRDVAWREIRWKICLLEGLQASREQKKPLMLWIFIDRPIDDERC